MWFERSCYKTLKFPRAGVAGAGGFVLQVPDGRAGVVAQLTLAHMSRSLHTNTQNYFGIFS